MLISKSKFRKLESRPALDHKLMKESSSNQPGSPAENFFASLLGSKRMAENRAKYNQHIGVIDALFQSANSGNLSDFKLLIQVANEACLKVLELTRSNFEAANQLARTFRTWPSQLSPSKRLNEETLAFIRKLELGREAKYPVNLEKGFQRATRQGVIVALLLNLTHYLIEKNEIFSLRGELHRAFEAAKTRVGSELQSFSEQINLHLSNFEAQLVRLDDIISQTVASLKSVSGLGTTDDHQIPEKLLSMVHQLPALTLASIEDWTNFGCQCLLSLTNGQPEAYPPLREIGRSRQDKYLHNLVRQQHGKVILDEVEKLRRQGIGEQSGESNIRDGIMEAIRNAYKTVALPEDEDL